MRSETWDGLGTPAAVVDYQYATPCYDQQEGALGTLPGAFNCQVHEAPPGSPYGHSPLIGFAKTTQTTKDYSGQVLSKAVTQFWQDYHKLGRPFREQAQDAGGATLQQADTAYTTAGNGPTYFSYASAVTQTTYSSGAQRATLSTYGQDGYGNPVTQYDYGDTTNPNDQRSIHRAFYANASAWIVGKLGWENIYEGITGNVGGPALKTQTIHYYDGAASYETPPVKGALTRVSRGGAGGSWQNTNTGYDTWGNPVVITDARGYTTTTAYETAYRLYPISVTNARGHVTQYQYYGVNGVPASGYLTGLLKSVTDSNSATTTYTYDAFGRLWQVFRPGDGTDPSQQYGYVDVGSTLFLNPFLVTAWQKPNSLKYAQRHFYDGLGREVQTHTAYTVTLSGYSTPQDVVVSMGYDARGNLAWQTAPYAMTAYAWNPSAPTNPYTTTNLATAPRTSHQYDALGRTSVITAPDGTVTRHYYALDNDANVGIPAGDRTGQWVHAPKDALGHAKHYVSDAYGRLVIVRDFTGTCYPGGSCTDPYWLYAQTRYGYDTLGNLTRVTDTLTNTTVITYNPLGQKTAMLDPDMGAWDYTYDAVGNLTAQDDAKHQRMCFYYDELNRLKGKYYANDSTACPASPTYVMTDTYDAGTYGKGQRTGMSDPSGSAAWTYDALGRVTQETKTVSGVTGSFVTAFGYDALDRVVTTTLPTGEVVTQTYNNLGTLNAVRSQTHGANYASGMQYNALSQLTQMTYGNGELLRWGYRGVGGNWDGEPSAGLTSFGKLYRIRAQTSAGAPLFDLRYAYDAVGNVTSIKEAPRSASGWPTSGFTFQDTFDTKNTSNWVWSTHQTVPFNDGGNNVVKNAGTGTDYNANFYRDAYSLTTGKGLQVRFKVDQTETWAHFSVEANDATYRRFGAVAYGGKLHMQYNDGSGYRYAAELLSNLQLNTWYVLRVVVDDSGRGFYVEAYQESSPSVRGSYTQWMPTGKSWRFHHWIYRGNAYLDDYREFNTSGLTWSPDERMTFTYDALDRLLSTAPESGAQGYSESYTYNPIGNLTSKGGVTQWYSDTAHVHAITHLTGTQKFWYDANGNMTKRIEGSATYSQTWDVENRLTVVTNTVSGAVTRFYYDGDGVRVKKVDSTGTTAYAGAVEVAITGTLRVTRTYYSANSLIAMRVVTSTGGNTLYYLHSDHLGSTSLTTDSSGNVTARQTYYPFGATRPGGVGTLPTDKRYTGQREESGLGSLYFYNARYYSPAIGRFLSADSIVPGAAENSSGTTTVGYDKSTRLTPLTTDFHEFVAQVGEENRTIAEHGWFFQWDEKARKEHPVLMGPNNPQALNRYSYVLNNPLRYTDPSGHFFGLFNLITGAIGAVASAVGSIVGQAATGQEIDWGNVAIAAGAGFVAGAIAPTTVIGAMVTQGLVNTGQYVVTQWSNNEPVTPSGVALNATVGVIAGRVSGPVPGTGMKLFQTGAGYTAGENLLRTGLNIVAQTAPVVAPSNLLRTSVASYLTNRDWTSKPGR